MLKKVNDTLLAAKPKWKSMDYGNLAKFAAEDIYAGVNWNGASMGRYSKMKRYSGHPIEGYPLWQDAVVVLLKQNVENAVIPKFYYGA